jgi:amino acid transporter
MAKESHLTTRLAAEQTGRLQRSLHHIDIVFLLVAAVVSIEVLGQVSSFGGETLIWLIVLAITFLFPYALIFAEVGGAFTDQGGPYVWAKMVFGRPVAAVQTILYWVTTPVWIGGSMAFLAYETCSSFLFDLPTNGLGDYIFKLGFIWITILSAILSLKYGKWFPTIGAILKVAILLFFVITTFIFALVNGVQGVSLGDLSPHMAGFLGLTPILLFAFLGFESGNSAGGEMHDASGDVPRAVAGSSFVAALCYIIPIAAILIVLPTKQITGISGLMNAMATVFSVYGPASGVILKLTAAVFIIVLIGQGAAWMIVSDRCQATAAMDGTFFGGFFGVFHKRLGTPVRVNLLTGVVATVFMFAAQTLVNGTVAAIFTVVLSICISTYLLSYLVTIPAGVMLRSVLPDAERSFRVPVSDRTFKFLGAICTAWIILGSWVALFPGTLELLFSIPYSFQDNWGISRATFEIFTLGTLVVLTALGLLGYVRARPVREQADKTETTKGFESYSG